MMTEMSPGLTCRRTTKSKITLPMKVDRHTASQTVRFLKRSIPKGSDEAEQLLRLIQLYESVLKKSDTSQIK